MAKVLHKKHDLKRPLILMAAVITIAFSCCCFVSQKDEALAKLDTNGLGAFPSCLSDSSYTSVMNASGLHNIMDSVNVMDFVGCATASSDSTGGFLYIADWGTLSACLGCKASIASGSLSYKFDHGSYNYYNIAGNCWAPLSSDGGGNAIVGYPRDSYISTSLFRYTDPEYCSGELVPSADLDVFRANYAQLVPLEIEDDDEGAGLDASAESSKYLFLYNVFTGVSDVSDSTCDPDELEMSYYPGGEKNTDPDSGDIYYTIILDNLDSFGYNVFHSSEYFVTNPYVTFEVQAKSGYVLTGFRVENQLDSEEYEEFEVDNSSKGYADDPIDIDNPKIIPIFEKGESPEPEQVLEKIEVTGMPTKTSYNVGDSFDPTGLKVTAYYAKGDSQMLLENLFAPAATKDVTNKVTFTPKTFTKAGAQKVTISYTEGKDTKTVDFPVNVAETSPTPTPAPSDGQAAESVEVQAPQTGDIVPVYALLGAAAASLCVVVVCARRRKQTQ